MKLYLAYTGKPAGSVPGQIVGSAIVKANRIPAVDDDFTNLRKMLCDKGNMSEVTITFWQPLIEDKMGLTLKSIIRVLAIGVAFGGGMVALQPGMGAIGIVATAIAAILMFI